VCPKDDTRGDVHLAIFARLNSSYAPGLRRTRSRRTLSRRSRIAAQRHVSTFARAIRERLRKIRDLARAAVAVPARGVHACRLVLFAAITSTTGTLGRAVAGCVATAHAARVSVASAPGAAWGAIVEGVTRLVGGIVTVCAAAAGAAQAVTRSVVAETRRAVARSYRAAGRVTVGALAARERRLAALMAAFRHATDRLVSTVHAVRASSVHVHRSARIVLARSRHVGRRVAVARAAARAAPSVALDARVACARRTLALARGWHAAGRTAWKALAPPTWSAGVLALVLMLAAALGRSEYSSEHGSGDEVLAGGGHDASSGARGSRLLQASAALRDSALPDGAVLGTVEDVASDPGDAATEVLLAAAENSSLVIAMASLRALRGRPCARVATPLARQLAHRDWQRRAWAAKVLGENGCAAVAPELKGRLARERDARVRRQLGAAVATLGARAAR
jgi:hypothetical protein